MRYRIVSLRYDERAKQTQINKRRVVA